MTTVIDYQKYSLKHKCATAGCLILETSEKPINTAESELQLNLQHRTDSTAAIPALDTERTEKSNTAAATDINSKLNTKLNWLRAGVLGANDGIVSTASLVVGVSGASVSGFALLVSGIAGLAAGALSMAAGEYVSVSTQRDAERAALHRQRQAIALDPLGAEKRLAGFIKAQGVSDYLSRATARELSAKDATSAHARYELNIDPDDLTNPWHAAGASMLAFALGAIIPLIAIIASPAQLAVVFTMAAVSIALGITGSVSAYLGKAPILPAVLRTILWGNIAMIVTYIIGTFVGGNIS
ncbi:VIT family protein [Arcanobacterium hippocoleae]